MKDNDTGHHYWYFLRVIFLIFLLHWPHKVNLVIRLRGSWNKWNALTTVANSKICGALFTIWMFDSYVFIVGVCHVITDLCVFPGPSVNNAIVSKGTLLSSGLKNLILFATACGLENELNKHLNSLAM